MKQIICINCPRGCRLTVTPEGDSWTVTGNFCARGKAYGIQEAENPRRTVTAVIPSGVDGVPCAPVRSTAPVPFALIPDLLNELYALRVTKGAKRGDVLLADWRGTGADIIYTADVIV